MGQIAIGLSPNTEKKDYIAAFKLLFTPGNWVKGKYIKKLEDWAKIYFNVSHAVSFDSGRSAEYAILKSLGIGKGSEVLIQAFTCVAVPNSVLWSGAKPVFVDIEKRSFNMDPQDLVKKVTNKSRAIIIQRTFGIIGDVREVREIARKYNLVLIEDCAHSLGGSINGDVAFFSFGRDKVISSVFGGMAITNNKKVGEKLLRLQKEISYPSKFWVVQQLLHPVLFSIILPTYNCLNVGKLLLVSAQRLRLLSIPVAPLEKIGGKPKFYPKRIPNALAKLALIQLERLESFNKRRREIARIYASQFDKQNIDGNAFLRYPLLVNNPKKLLKFAKKRKILLGDWYSNIVDPKDVNLRKVGYVPRSCPTAEAVASKIVNLPTYPRMTRGDVEKVINIVKKFYVRNKSHY